jgi:O-antigen/teichoic acid export membrane protein
LLSQIPGTQKARALLGAGLSVSLIGGSTLIGLASTALTYLLVARSASPSDFGRIMASMAAVFVVADLLDLGHNTRLLRDLTRTFDLTDWYRSSFLPKTVLGFAICVLWCGSVATLGAPSTLLILGLPLIGQVAAQSMLVILRVQQRTKFLAGMQAGERTIALAAAVALLEADMPLDWLLPLALFIGQLSVVVASMFAIRKSLDNYRFAPKFGTNLFRSWRFCLMTLLTDAAQLNIVLVSSIAGSRVGGLFSAPVRLTGVFTAFVYSGATFLLPRLSVSRNRNDGALNGMLALLLIVTLSSLSLAFAAPNVVQRVLGEQYVDAVVPLVLLSLAAIPSACSQLGGIYLIASRQEKVLLRIHSVFALVGMLAVSTGAAVGQQNGAALGSLCNTLLVALAILFYNGIRSRNPARSNSNAWNPHSPCAKSSPTLEYPSEARIMLKEQVELRRGNP